MPDLITDPRWGRNQECYSEDTEVVQRLITAAVQALQGGAELSGDSVIATIKHFPGAGAQTGGVDGTPLTIQEDSLELHLAGFKAGIAAGAAAVMPYGYSTVPMLGGDAVDNSADQSAVVMTDLLRGQLGYTGHHSDRLGSEFCGRDQRRCRHSGRHGRSLQHTAGGRGGRGAAHRCLPPDSECQVPAGHL